MKQRPLSPHLQIYKPQISSVISILHRAAGLVLIGGLLLLCWALLAAADSALAYQTMLDCVSSQTGQLALLGLTVCFFFYFLAELRYLGWAFGYGFSIPVMTKTGWLVVLGTALFTTLVWL